MSSCRALELRSLRSLRNLCVTLCGGEYQRVYGVEYRIELVVDNVVL